MAILTIVRSEGKGRLNPSVYLSPMAQAISNRPARKRQAHATLRRHAETKASCALWKDGRGTTCHLLLDPDHLRNPIRLFPRVSLVRVWPFRAGLRVGAR